MAIPAIASPVRLTVPQFADYCGVSVSTVRWWIQQNTAPRSYLLGRRRVFDLSDVMAWENDQRAKGAR
jgi:excisionase family DNA binding protein